MEKQTGDGCALAKLDANGMIDVSPIVEIDVSAGHPSELCWVAVTPDDKFIFGAKFGYGWIYQLHRENGELKVAKDPACPKVPGDGTALGLDGVVISGPSDNWISPDGAFLYQISGNASKLIGYVIHDDGSLEEVTSVAIPYNSSQGLAGFRGEPQGRHTDSTEGTSDATK